MKQASEIDLMIKSLQRTIAERDERIIAALRKGEDTTELERKVADDLMKLNGLRNISSPRRDNRLCLAAKAV